MNVTFVAPCPPGDDSRSTGTPQVDPFGAFGSSNMTNIPGGKREKTP